MLETLVEFDRRLLQLHACHPGVRRSGPLTHETVNLLLHVDKWWLHNAASIGVVRGKASGANSDCSGSALLRIN
jgi:hypothetical protein